MKDVLEQRLAAKKRDLKQMQDFLKIDMENNINAQNYEDNAINTLLNMKKLKNGNCGAGVDIAVVYYQS